MFTSKTIKSFPPHTQKLTSQYNSLSPWGMGVDGGVRQTNKQQTMTIANKSRYRNARKGTQPASRNEEI